MKEFTIPEGGFVLKTELGRPVLELLVHDEGSTLSLFDVDGEPRVALATRGNSGAALVGDPATNGLVLSAGEDLSEIAVFRSGKHIALALNQEKGEIRLVNAANATLAKIYEDDNGGQIGLGDQRGTLAVSAGAGENGGVACVMNTAGKTVVFLSANEREDAGNVTLLDQDGDPRILVDTNIHVIRDGRIVWTTMNQ
jgi:hypothetical protein